MNLQYLKYFYAIARCGSFVQAAKELNYAQSNLSARIKQLEQDLGTSLFIRSKKGVTLTEKGQQLLPYAQKLLSLSNEAESLLSSSEIQTGSLRIGAMESSAITFLPSILADYHRQIPKVNLSLSTGISRTLTNNVKNYELDCAFVAGKLMDDDLLFQYVRDEELVILSEKADISDSSWKDMLEKSILVFPFGCSYRQRLLSVIEEQGLLPGEIMEFSSLGSILTSVAAGMGIAIFPRSVASVFVQSDSLSVHPLPEKYSRIQIYVVSRIKDHNQTLRKFIECVTKFKK